MPTSLPSQDDISSGSFTVDPKAIPALRATFLSALTKLDVQIDLAISDIRLRPWAGDPVSQQAASDFNDHGVLGVDSALDGLQKYQRQLKGALDALEVVERGYHTVEGNNTSIVQGGC